MSDETNVGRVATALHSRGSFSFFFQRISAQVDGKGRFTRGVVVVFPLEE